jgi:hypothetical protein
VAFNRALAAKAYVFRATALNSTCGPATCYNAALAALALAGPGFAISDPTQLKKGVYLDYSPGAGDLSNELSDALDAPNFFALPLLIDLAQKQTDGTTPDQRAETKIAPQTAGTPQQLGGIGILGTHKFTIYLSGGEPNPSAPIPVIRSEELPLLRAEANIGLNDLGSALTDINFIRTTAGLLPALGSLGTKDQAIAELLYNRKYSLLWEQGGTWLDARRYGLLNTIPIPPGFANSTPPNNNFGTSNVPTRLLVPDDECRARALESGCSPLGT